MPSTVFAVPILAGKTEAWKQAWKTAVQCHKEFWKLCDRQCVAVSSSQIAHAR